MKAPKHKWLTPAQARKIPEGSVVLVRVKWPETGAVNHYLEEYFRPDSVSKAGGYDGIAMDFPMKFLLISPA